jgi:hypothetical protein
MCHSINLHITPVSFILIYFIQHKFREPGDLLTFFDPALIPVPRKPTD